ncbi:hypothetical protein ACWC6I_42700 [Streptomyces sp. NPDC001414]
MPQEWRGMVLEPLRAAVPTWMLDRMSAELARRFEAGAVTAGPPPV